MNLKKTFAASFAALALAGTAAGVAQADTKASTGDPNTILSCVNAEVINIPILSDDLNTFDCSHNAEAEEENTVVLEGHGYGHDR